MREKLFSVTAADCRFLAKRGSGNGGQKKQKTSSAIQCFHDPSGAMGECENGRSQSLNKIEAFRRMSETPAFKTWLRLKIDAAKGHVLIDEMDERGFKSRRNLRMDEV